ncbi:NAD(P)-dependent alcohol dehydrogenase [Demequina flava]|uniref:NAD(P)-dependent alcohol dehydrogenase n=1 Tax=Demequina flava TaxID=1095025 RepID=UPI0007854365|nr:NAD(P)-dependent alcohol dehydrogenase [Demequina flava]
MSTIPETMTAAVQPGYGPVSGVAAATRTVPSPAPGQVLIRVEAAALNPADVFTITGTPAVVRASKGVRSPKQPVPGSDAAGVVVAVGEGDSEWNVGDRVFGMASGALAEYALSKVAWLVPTPDGVSSESAAASVMVGLTALHGLRRAGLDPWPTTGEDQPLAGKRVLVIGAGGGVGSATVQIAAGAGAHVTGVCSAGVADAVAALGAHRTVDYATEDVLALEGGFDLILDNVGAVPMLDLEQLVAPSGILFPNSGIPGPDGGAITRVAKANWHGKVRRRRIGTFLSTVIQSDMQLVADHLADGSFTPLVDSRWNLTQASAALQHIADGHVHGKVVVTPGR